MIVVTGATGQLGRAIVERLRERVPAAGIGVSVRDPAKAEGLAERGVRVRRGDYDDPASLGHAFEGASASCSCRQRPPARRRCGSTARRSRRRGRPAPADRLHEPHGREPAVAVRADARPRRHRGGARSSRASPSPRCATASTRRPASCSSGRRWTPGELVAPEDGPVSWTAHADLADAAAIVLTEDGFDGLTPPLTGSEALDLAGLAASPRGQRTADPRVIVVTDARVPGRTWSPTVCRSPRRTCSSACSRRAAGASSPPSTRRSSA